MTSRDFEIIDFISKYKVVSTNTLSHFFFNSIHSCYKVTHRLFTQGHINRMKLIQNSINSSYVYYINKPPAQLKHALTITEFMTKWDSKFSIQDFIIQQSCGSIIPDAIMYSNDNIFLLEVELSKKGFNYMKYEKFFSSNEYTSYFNCKPTVLIYSNNKINIPTNTIGSYRIFSIS